MKWQHILIPFGLVLASLAWAGESRFLGTIYSRGTSVTNRTTQASLSDGGLVDNSFWIPFAAKLTMECDGEARLLTDATVVSRDGGTDKGVRVTEDTLFPTSVSGPLGTTDAGLPTAIIAIISSASDAGVACDVWQRSGTE
jgi:hypothetical protein